MSTCRKSQARIPDAWDVRNWCHVGDVRRGAGPSPALARIRRIVPPREHAGHGEVYEPKEHERRG
ncbi:MAG: hypothetical protein ACLP8X_32880 [Streptosporangiaceae bacterium]